MSPVPRKVTKDLMFHYLDYKRSCFTGNRVDMLANVLYIDAGFGREVSERRVIC
jgi:hypothetical protein